jgi:predicted amidophosphoribosyltransferase
MKKLTIEECERVLQTMVEKDICEVCGEVVSFSLCECHLKRCDEHQIDPIEHHLAEIIALLGFDKSESATQQFAELLQVAAKNAVEVGAKSIGEEGLFYNLLPVIASELRRG